MGFAIQPSRVITYERATYERAVERSWIYAYELHFDIEECWVDVVPQLLSCGDILILFPEVQATRSQRRQEDTKDHGRQSLLQSLPWHVIPLVHPNAHIELSQSQVSAA